MIKRNKNGLTEKEFLERYNPGNYPKPSVTVDAMIFRMKEDLSCMQVLLIQRKDHPCLDQWALPGGFINMDESAYEAVCRELQEETGLTGMYMEQLYTMNKPDRDPRMRIIDIAYIALLPYEKASDVIAGDDAKNAVWFDITFTDDVMELSNREEYIKIKYVLTPELFKNGRITITNPVPHQTGTESLAFDHAEIILEGLMRLRSKVLYTDIAFNLVPEEFTMPDLQKVYEVISGKKMYSKNFREKARLKVERLQGTAKPLSSTRVSALYKYKEDMTDNKEVVLGNTL